MTTNIPHRKSIRKIRVLAAAAGAALFWLALRAPQGARAAPAAGFDVERNRAVLDFPNTITFQLTVGGGKTIERIVLEYGVDRLTCGEVVAKAFPDFEPSARVEAEWTWDMRQSGSEPPGADVWWQWRVTDSDGNEQLVRKEEITWIDSTHPWQEDSEESIVLHWYAGGTAFGKDMLASAVGSVRHIDELINLKPEGTVHIYLYASYEDLQEAVLYEAGWTGGQSYGEHNIIILGVPEGYEDWAKAAIAHELMHNVVDRFTFSCLAHIPTWVHEGLAMVSEGGPGEQEMEDLQDAIDENSIFPLRSLGGGFPEDPDLANLAYTQSFSVVDFLLRRGDASRMRSLLELLGDGTTADDALLQLYGFNVDGLDAAWRESVGATPLAPEDLAPTATPTVVPTYPPLSFHQEVVPTTGPGTPTLTPSPVATASGGGFPFAESLIGLCLCGLCLLPLTAVGAAVLFAIARSKR